MSGIPNSVIAAILNDAVDELRRAIYIERDGVLVWGGPVWFTDGKDPLTKEIQGAEWWSLFAGRLITSTKTYVAGVDDQLAIARDLVTYAQSKPGGALGITVGAETSGVTRDRTYNYYEDKPVAEAVAQLAALQNGFDFSIDVAYSPAGDFLRNFHLWYPRRGRIAGDTGHVWELGRNIVSLSWPTDATKAANAAYGIGAGEGDSMLRSTAVRSDMWAAGYPLIETSVSLKDVSEQDTLDSHTRAEADRKAQPVSLPPIIVRGDIDPVIGAYMPGDEARIRIEPNTDGRFPNGLDTYRRIVTYEVTVDDNGAGENVAITTDKAVAA